MTLVLTSAEETRALKVLDGIELRGQMNTEAAHVVDHVRGAIRRGHPQVWRHGLQSDVIALVGSGPSLASTERELVELIHGGAKLVTVNGGYHWCLARNLKPSAQIVLDARASTARFLLPAVPQCRYYVASQCHPDAWDVVEDREYVGIFHAVSEHGDGTLKAILDEFYAGQWQGVAGGTTVTTRAIGLLRMLGYLRFEVFGVDSCWLGDAHHALPQPENQTDRQLRVTVAPTDRPDLGRTFSCAPWMLKQAEDVLQMVRLIGDHFLLNFHGDGLLAFMMQTSADLAVSVVEDASVSHEGV